MNANQFLKAVSQLQGWRECAFLLALAERSFPNYALFADAVGLKTGAKMRQMLDLGWDLLQKNVPESGIPQLLAKLEALSPDVNAYDAYGVYPAFDFCQLLEQALLNRLNPAKHRATDASLMATSTVMNFIELSEGELLLDLKRQRTPTDQFVARLRENAANEGISNLGISLNE